MAIQERLANLKHDIRTGRLTSEEIFQKYLIDGPTYFFNEYHTDPALEYAIKSKIATAFSVHIREIIIVGSAKLGFSLKPGNLFNEFDSLYQKTKNKRSKSDLDIAIVSTQLYDKIARSLYNFTSAYKNQWQANEYYSGNKARQFDIPICYKYFEYYTKGWFRPDFKPQGFEFCTSGSYEELKGQLFEMLHRRIGIAVYQNWFYFMDYHLANINNLKFKLKETV